MCEAKSFRSYAVSMLTLRLLLRLPEVPLNNFHAQYNHALMTMFSGYHPDAYWEFKPKKDAFEENGIGHTTSTEPVVVSS